MSVAVYSRLDELLQAKGMTVGDLRQQIAARFGLMVDARTLGRLAHADRVRRPDLEAAAAAAAVLAVGLGDLFAVEVTPVADADKPQGGGPIAVEDEHEDDALTDVGDDVLDPDQSRHLRDLYDKQNRRALTAEEWAEMGELVAAYGRGLRERRLREIAARREQPVEEVEAEAAVDLERALVRRRELEHVKAMLMGKVYERQKVGQR